VTQNVRRYALFPQAGTTAACPLNGFAEQQVNGKPAQCVAAKAWECHCLFPKAEFAEPFF
jgi:hypothetical protein